MTVIDSSPGAETSLASAMASLEVALDGAEAAPWEYNLETRHVEWSPRGYLQLGRTIGETQPSLQTFLAHTHPDDRDKLTSVRTKELTAPPGTKFTLQLRLIKADGEIRWIERRSIIGPDEPEGRRVFGVDIDITARVEVEEKLRESEERHRELAEFMPQIVWQADAEGILRYVNNRWTEMTGLPVSDALGKPWLPGMLPEDLQSAQQAWTAAQQAGSIYEHEWRLRLPDGSLRWLLTRGRPIKDESGRIVRWIGTDTDITERKTYERQLRLLINELNHRVKNTLATVQSIAGQTLRCSGDIDEARARFEERLVALAHAHDILTKESWEGAVLRDIIETTTAPHRSTGAERFILAGPHVRLPPQYALALAMALHELCTNAAKYGALSVREGKVMIAWEVTESEGARKFRICWQEIGGPPVTPPSRRGFGTRLIEQGLHRDLEGSVKMQFAPEGAICVIEAPLVQNARMLEVG